uniref:Uncharacterized protein n=1 Tax=Knipowitschia caucasica TaxID=637954 RepID=A0AAV2JYY6_KNICA
MEEAGEVPMKEAKEFAESISAIFIETSARNSVNIEALFQKISKQIPPLENTEVESNESFKLSGTLPAPARSSHIHHEGAQQEQQQQQQQQQQRSCVTVITTSNRLPSSAGSSSELSRHQVVPSQPSQGPIRPADDGVLPSAGFTSHSGLPTLASRTRVHSQP